ncbi:hypothetical protein ACM614_11955 [Streptomyces sp. 12297]|uniref:hypothetical protein n=1 Tax=Streptomyces sp. NBC_00239 TaxID=2903640 RepID=UPI002E28905C|nr:hypothetical protein [Streptomyces sp. NBC_00239]
MAVGATDTGKGRPVPLRVYDSWWTVSATALGAVLLITGGLWMSTHLRTDPALHDAALFVHLASLVLGFGAVLSADWYGALWLTGRCSLGEVTAATARLHTPIWAGLAGLVGSGVMLHPDLGSPLTQTKLLLVLILTVNGLQAGALGERLNAHGAAAAGRDGAPAAVPTALLVRCAVTAGLSQICWWGAVVIGFLNTRN